MGRTQFRPTEASCIQRGLLGSCTMPLGLYSTAKSSELLVMGTEMP